MTPVFLLAAGLGTRLRPLTDWLPKPLLPVGDEPALAHILEHIRPVARSIVVNVHHRAGDVRTFLAEEATDVRVAEEVRILGTAGGLANAASLLGAGDVLVWNGDILSNLDPAELLAAHRRDSRATLATRRRTAGEGNVGVDATGRIVRLRGETVASGEVSGGEFLGIHVVGEALRAHLPTEGCLVGDIYLPALRKGELLRTFEPRDLTWHDIGTLADYEAANLAWLRAKGESSFVGAGATIEEGVTLRDCIVGRNARIDGEGTLTGCIVWPDARVTAPCAPSVVTPWGVVPFRG